MLLSVLLASALAAPSSGGLTLHTTPLGPGDDVALTVGGLGAGEPVLLAVVAGPGGQGPCYAEAGGLCVDLGRRPSVVGLAFESGGGVATFETVAPVWLAPGDTYTFQALAVRGWQGAHSTTSNTVTRTVSPTLCGDGTLDPLEACDDGNREPGDGCDATCDTEACAVSFSPVGTFVWTVPGHAAGPTQAVTADSGHTLVLDGHADSAITLLGTTAASADTRWTYRYDLTDAGAGTIQGTPAIAKRQGSDTWLAFEATQPGRGIDPHLARIDADGNVRWTLALDRDNLDHHMHEVVTSTSARAYLVDHATTGQGERFAVTQVRDNALLRWTSSYTTELTDPVNGPFAASQAGGGAHFVTGTWQGKRVGHWVKIESGGAYTNARRLAYSIDATDVDVHISAADDGTLGQVVAGTITDPTDGSIDPVISRLRGNFVHFWSQRIDLGPGVTGDVDVLVVPEACRYTEDLDSCESSDPGDRCTANADEVCICGGDDIWHCSTDRGGEVAVAWQSEDLTTDIAVAHFSLATGDLIDSYSLDSGADDSAPHLSVDPSGVLVVSAQTPTGAAVFRVDDTRTCSTDVEPVALGPVSLQLDTASVVFDTTVHDPYPATLTRTPLAPPDTERRCYDGACAIWVD